MLKLKTVFGIVWLNFVLIGCTSPVIDTGFHSDYAKLKRGEHLQRCFVNQSAISINDYSGIVIRSITTKNLINRRGISINDSKHWLESYLKRSASAKNIPILTEDSFGANPVLLELCITEMTPGDERYQLLSSGLGAGHAYIQVEGRVLDSISGEELFLFSERERSTGKDRTTGMVQNSGPQLVLKMIEKISEDIVDELQLNFGL